jgi:hypothetical protein
MVFVVFCSVSSCMRVESKGELHECDRFPRILLAFHSVRREGGFLSSWGKTRST